MGFYIHWKHYTLDSAQFTCTLSAIKAYNRYQSHQKVLWINPAANTTFLIITPETAGFKPLTPGTGGKSSQLTDSVKVWGSTQPETLTSGIYLIFVIHFKCVAALFGLSPEG